MSTTIWTGATSSVWNLAGNWSNGVPVNGSDAVFEDNAVSVTGSDESAVTLGSLTIRQSYTGYLGSAATPLKIKCSGTVSIGEYYGSSVPAGSARINLDLSTTACTIVVHNSATAGVNDLPPIRLICVNTSTMLQVRKGWVGIAVGSAAEVATLDTIDVSFIDSAESDARVEVGAGVTLENIKKTGGTVIARCAVTVSTTQEGGTLQTEGTGALSGTTTIKGGNFYPNSTGTINSLVLNGGLTDTSRSNLARTASAVQIDPTTPEGVQFIKTDRFTVTAWTSPTGRVMLSGQRLAA